MSPQGIPGTDHPSVFKLWRVRCLPFSFLFLQQTGSEHVLTDSSCTYVHMFTQVGDMDGIDGYIKAHAPAAAVVMGGGFVGLEMAEAFAKRGLRTTVVEFLPTVMAAMDAGFGRRVAGELRANGVEVRTGVAVKAYHPEAQEVELSDGSRVPAGIVLVSVGVRPELDLARKCGAFGDVGGGCMGRDVHAPSLGFPPLLGHDRYITHNVWHAMASARCGGQAWPSATRPVPCSWTSTCAPRTPTSSRRETWWRSATRCRAGR